MQAVAFSCFQFRIPLSRGILAMPDLLSFKCLESYGRSGDCCNEQKIELYLLLDPGSEAPLKYASVLLSGVFLQNCP